MNEYLLSVIGTVLFSAILLAILPEGKTTDLIKGMARLACLVAILAPVAQFFVEGGDFNAIFQEKSIETQASFIEYCSDKHIKEAENLLENELKARYAFVESVALQCVQETGDEKGYQVQIVRVEYVKIFIRTAISFEQETAIKECLEKEFGCKGVICRIV